MKVNILSLMFIFSALFVGLKALTHHTIKFIPGIFTLDFNKGDVLQMKVYNTTGSVKLYVRNYQNVTLQHVNEFGFSDRPVSLQHIFQSSLQNASIFIFAASFQFSYEIKINNEVWKKQQNIVRDFKAFEFIYPRIIPIGNQTIEVYFQSNNTDMIQITFLRKPHLIFANTVNVLTVDYNLFPYYIINVDFPRGMGCDEENSVYDPRMRVCPSNKIQKQSSVEIQKIGTFLTFQLNEKTTNFIVITVVDAEKIMKKFSQVRLRMFMANSSNSKIFNNQSIKNLDENYPSYLCTSISRCVIKLNFEPGNYTVMPLIEGEGINGGFVYLFERKDKEKNLIESFYTMMLSKIEHYPLESLMTFSTKTQNLTEITLECAQKFYLFHFTITGHSEKNTQNFMKDETVLAYKSDAVFNQNPYKATFYADLKPNSVYSLRFILISHEKFSARAEIQATNDQIHPQERNIDQLVFLIGNGFNQLCLEADSLKFSVKNGIFPFKNLNNQSSLTLNDRENQNGPILQHFVLGSIGIVAFLVVLKVTYTKMKSIKAKKNQMNEQKTRSCMSSADIDLKSQNISLEMIQTNNNPSLKTQTQSIQILKIKDLH